HFLRELTNYRKMIFQKRANEVNLLLNAGFLGVVLSHTRISDNIQQVSGSLASVSVMLMIFMTIVIVSFLSLIGVHQFVTISTIVAIVLYDDLGIHVITMSMMLLSAWAVSTSLFPVSPIMPIVSGLLKENVYKIIVRWNLLYAVVISIVHTIIIYLFHLFIL